MRSAERIGFFFFLIGKGLVFLLEKMLKSRII